MGHRAQRAAYGDKPAHSRWNLANGLKLFAFAGVVIVAVTLAMSEYRHAQSRIGSADYQSISVGKDLLTDIRPTASYIVEAYLTILQASADPKNRDRYFSDYRQHKDAYFDQLKRWENADLPARLGKLITVDSPTVLDRFWIEAENNFFPKLETAGGNTALAQSLDLLAERFAQHKAIMQRAAGEAEAHIASLERQSETGMTMFGWLIQAAVGVGLLLIVGLFVALHRSFARPLANVAAYAGDLASGETDADVPYAHRRDDVGHIAEALAFFRDTTAENLESERRAAAERQRAADVKARSDAELAARAEQTDFAVAALGQALTRLADGDLDCQLDDPFDGDLETLRTDFNIAVARISEAFDRIVQSATAIETGSKEISTASEDLSRRTEQQAASLEETAATLDQITATVQKSSEDAESTRKLVKTAREDAEASGDIVHRALEAMGGIEKSATEINQIISVIDEIAFQTNLLALNAGVEAARAGDAGKGFAVVAQEVRELAQRSATAAKEIKGLIAKSSDQVANGSELVNATGETLHRIAGRVVEISGVIDEIASGAGEQSVALKQLNSSVGEMDKVTQQNAAMAEQATAASHSLSQEIENLAELVAAFRAAEPAPRFTRPKAPVRPAVKRPARAASAYRGRSVGNTALKDDWEEF